MNLFKILCVISSFSMLLSCCSELRFGTEGVQLTQFFSSKRTDCDNLLNNIKEKEADKFGTVNKAPKTLEESFIYLDTLINDDIKEWIKCLPDGEFGIYVHHGFGTYLRNNWKLWGVLT